MNCDMRRLEVDSMLDRIQLVVLSHVLDFCIDNPRIQPIQNIRESEIRDDILEVADKMQIAKRKASGGKIPTFIFRVVKST
jgi:hypothetical protein